MNSVGKIHRVSRALYLMKIPILPKALMFFNRIIFSCDIPYSAEVHPSVMFGHNGLGTVIHSKATIGENSLIMQHVTIGGNKSKKNVYKGKEITRNNKPRYWEECFYRSRSNDIRRSYYR